MLNAVDRVDEEGLLVKRVRVASVVILVSLGLEEAHRCSEESDIGLTAPCSALCEKSAHLAVALVVRMLVPAEDVL